ISSPIPVTETAPRGPAYNPAPTIGESPTRPGSMNATPPVDEPVAKRPRRSRATAPTVSWIATPFHFRAYRGSRPFRIFSRLSSRFRRDSGVDGSYRGWPFDRANATASAPAKRMCGVFRTSYATRIGFFTSSIAATAPASRSQFISDASAEFVTDRAKLVHRLVGRTRDGPIFRFLACANRTPIETAKRHDSRCAGDHLRRDGPRLLRTELDADFSEQPRHAGIDLGCRLNARALRAPPGGRDGIEERLREHTPERVLDADEEDGAHGIG